MVIDLKPNALNVTLYMFIGHWSKKGSNWGYTDLIFKQGVEHGRCQNVEFAHRNCMNFRVHANNFHREYLLLLWSWQKSKWSGWCMLGSSFIEVSTLMIKKSFKPKADSLYHLQKFQIWKISIIGMTLKRRSSSNV